MQGKFIYVAVASLLGVCTSFLYERWEVFLFSFLYFIYIVFLHHKRVFIVSLLCYLFFLTFTHYYDANNNTSLYRDMKQLKGRVVTVPKEKNNSIEFYFKVEESREVVQVYAPFDTTNTHLKLSSNCVLNGNLAKPPQSGHQYEFNYREYLRQKRIHWIFYTNTIVCEKARQPFFLSELLIWRHEQINSIKREFPKASAGIVQALLFGDRSSISKDVMRIYKRFGIIHVLAVSGMHVGLFLGFSYILLLRIGITKEKAIFFLLVMIPIYCLLTGATPSVVRASLMAFCFLFYMRIKRKIPPLDVLATVFTLIIFFNPYYIFNIGFQLSFIVSLSLLLSIKLLRGQSKRMQLLVTSYVAYLSSFPVLLYHFFEVSIIAIPLNLIYVPFITLVVLPSAYVLFFLQKIVPFLAQPLLYLFSNSIDFVHNLLIGIDVAIPTVLTLGRPSLFLMVLYTCIILRTFIVLECKTNKLRAIIIKSSIPFLFVVVLDYCLPYVSSEGEVSIIDVGQGDSILLSLPNRRAIYLIDTGGKKEKGIVKDDTDYIGGKILIPFLKGRGITKINRLIITHGDYDHFGATKTLMKAVEIEKVIVNTLKPSIALETVINEIISSGGVVSVASEGDSWIEGEVPFKILSPTLDNGGKSKNDQSIVLWSVLGGSSWLFTGDLEKSGENELLKRYPELKIDVLKVGHHGSRTSSGITFIKQLNPSIALISAGKNNRYNHPHEEVLDAFRKHNITILRTDKHGTITYTFSSKSGTFKTFSPYSKE